MHRYSVLPGVFLSSILLLGIFSCNKEYSYEGGYGPSVATGTLLDSMGNCNTISIKGSYKPGAAFTGANYITVQANITNPGSYTIYTDTINGYYFEASGYVTSTGIQPVQLAAYGKSLLDTAAIFTVHFDSSECRFSILIPADTTGNNFMGTCGAAIVNGKYNTGVPLDVSNSVDILVNVISPGPYTITTAVVNGISFGATGNFTTPGNLIIKLAGSGTPLVAGNTTIPVIIESTSCSFDVPVTEKEMMYPLYWKYTVDSSTYLQGILDSGIVSASVNMLYPANTVYAMQVYGAANGPLVTPITFQLNIARINHILSTGSYNPGITGSTDFIGYVGHFDITGNLSASNGLPEFAIAVTTYNAATRLVEGIFSGPVIDDFGRTHTIINGAFRTYFKK